MQMVKHYPKTFSHFFDEFFDHQKGGTPAIDIYEQGDRYTIEAEVPGYKIDEIKVEVKDGVLVLSGEKMKTEEKNERNYSYRERQSEKFQRTFYLQQGIDEDKIKALLKDGVLTLELMKKEEKRAKLVQIAS